MPIVPDKYRGTVTYSIALGELLRVAQVRGLLTYQELALAVGLPLQGAHMGAELGHLLGEISEDEHEHHRPMLSAIVVGVGGQPGPGFFSLARQLQKLLRGGAQPESSFWETERKAVYDTWKRPLPA